MKIKEWFGKFWAIAVSVIGFIGVGTFAQFHFHNSDKTDAENKRINQITVSVDKGATSPDVIDFVVTVYNGGDVNMKDVTIISPVNLVKMDNSKVPLDKSGMPRGISLGDIGPSKEVEKEIVVENDGVVLSSSFEIEFKDNKNNWWSKKLEKMLKKREIQHCKRVKCIMRLKKQIKIHYIKEAARFSRSLIFLKNHFYFF